jgi:hypothetical protein
MYARAFSACLCLGLGLALSARAAAADLSGSAQAVMPQSTRQVISLNYQKLEADPLAQQLEAQVLPPEMRSLSQLLARGGVNAASDLNRLTFATYAAAKGIGLIGVAEGNLGGLQLAKFYTRTKQQPNPPQMDGVNVYAFGGLTFFMPDNATLVFGSRDAVRQAIATEQGAPQIGANSQMSDLIAGTQSSDVWSVIDAQGAQAMVGSLVGASAGGLGADLIKGRFNGARYTIAFGNQIQVNMELMTADALTAAAVSTGLNAAIAMRERSESNPVARSILNQVQVDSAGDNAFLQVAADQSSVAQLMHTDLMQTILH